MILSILLDQPGSDFLGAGLMKTVSDLLLNGLRGWGAKRSDSQVREAGRPTSLVVPSPLFPLEFPCPPCKMVGLQI